MNEAKGTNVTKIMKKRYSKKSPTTSPNALKYGNAIHISRESIFGRGKISKIKGIIDVNIGISRQNKLKNTRAVITKMCKRIYSSKSDSDIKHIVNTMLEDSMVVDNIADSTN